MAIALPACVYPVNAPRLAEPVCRFEQGILGNLTIATPRQTLHRSVTGWERTAAGSCANPRARHTTPDGATYAFTGHGLRFAPDRGSAREIPLETPADIVAMDFRTSRTRITAADGYATGHLLYAYAVDARGVVWIIELTRDGAAGAVARHYRIPRGWTPRAIATANGPRGAILAAHGERSRIFRFRLR